MARLSLTIFFVTTAALVAVVSAAVRILPNERNIAQAEEPHHQSLPDCFLSTDNRTTLDQLVFHHDLEDVGSALSNADVVFLGNSRSLCAFPASTCGPWFEQRKLNWFHAGFPAESNVFTQHILERHDVRPKFVIVNADNFFNDKMSTIARRSVDTTRFGAEKRYWESRLSFQVRRQLHNWVPHFPTQLLAQESMVVHRSLTNGCWYVADAKGQPSAVQTSHRSEFDLDQLEQRIRVASAFQRFVQDRGGELIITYVPSTSNDWLQAQQLAERLECRFIAPQLDGLTTWDGSHLDTSSAIRFSTAFLKSLNLSPIAMQSRSRRR